MELITVATTHFTSMSCAKSAQIVHHSHALSIYKLLYFIGIGTVILMSTSIVGKSTSTLTPSNEEITDSPTNSTDIANVTNSSIEKSNSDNDTYMSQVIDIDYMQVTTEYDENDKNISATVNFRDQENSEIQNNSKTPLTTVSIIFEPIITTSESNEIPSDRTNTITTWFVMILDGNCSLQGEDLINLRNGLTNALVVRLPINRRNVQVHDTWCSSPDQMHVNVTIAITVTTTTSCIDNDYLATLLTNDQNNINNTGPLVRIEHHDYYVYKIMTADGHLIEPEVTIPIDLRHTDVELIVFIAIGSICAFLIILIVGLLVCKYICNRDSTSHKPFDSGYFFDRQPPPGGLHLEDYTLTRIPRPKLGYVDYCRGGANANKNANRYSQLDDQMIVTTSPNGGTIRPYDTSVVQLEDDNVGESSTANCRDGVIVRPMDIRRYGQSITRFYRNGRGLKSPIGVGKTIEVTDGINGQSYFQSRSTDNLNHDRDADHVVFDRGVDNPVYQ